MSDINLNDYTITYSIEYFTAQEGGMDWGRWGSCATMEEAIAMMDEANSSWDNRDEYIIVVEVTKKD